MPKQAVAKEDYPFPANDYPLKWTPSAGPEKSLYKVGRDQRPVRPLPGLARPQERLAVPVLCDVKSEVWRSQNFFARQNCYRPFRQRPYTFAGVEYSKL